MLVGDFLVEQALGHADQDFFLAGREVLAFRFFPRQCRAARSGLQAHQWRKYFVLDAGMSVDVMLERVDGQQYFAAQARVARVRQGLQDEVLDVGKGLVDLRVVREDGLFFGGEVVLQLPAEIGQETADDLLLCLGTRLRQRFDAVAQAGQRLVQIVVMRAMQVFKHVLDAAGTQLAERRAEEGIGIHFTEQQEGVGIYVAVPA